MSDENNDDVNKVIQKITKNLKYILLKYLILDSKKWFIKNKIEQTDIARSGKKGPVINKNGIHAVI